MAQVISDNGKITPGLQQRNRTTMAQEVRMDEAAFQSWWQRHASGILPNQAIYTTNAIESLNRSLRKISKNRGVFPHEESLLKLYYMALERIAKKWTMPIHNWSAALNRFAIEFAERMPQLN